MVNKLTCQHCGKVNPAYVIERCVKCGEHFPNYKPIVRDPLKFSRILIFLLVFGGLATLVRPGATTSDLINIVIGSLILALIVFGINRLFRRARGEDKIKEETQLDDGQVTLTYSEQEKLDEEALLGHPSSKPRRKTSKKKQERQVDQETVEL